MSAFAGIVTFERAPVDKEAEDRVHAAVTALGEGPVVARRSEGALFAQRVPAARNSAHGEPPVTGRDGRTLFAALARLDNRDELGAALEITSPELARTPD